MAEQFIGPYRIVREIGRGGMGAVYEAVQPRIERRVAIKVLHPQFAQNEQLVTRFFNEARAVNIVNHPSVVQISEFAQLPDGTAYIVMEFLDGESLGGRMKRSGGRIAMNESLRLTRQIAAALAAAHARGIIHRDLKPDNVMIVSDPEAPGGERAKILDFGIAKLAAVAVNPGGDGDVVSQTRTGMMVGTPLYMAPEQCRGSGNVDDRVDVYALGIMLYRMLCGRPPFMGDGAGAVMAMHIYEPPPPLRGFEPSVPEDLAALVHQLLEKSPAARPSMAQVTQRLEQLRAIHATGPLQSAELRAFNPSGNLSSAAIPAITPAPATPIPLSGGAHSQPVLMGQAARPGSHGEQGIDPRLNGPLNQSNSGISLHQTGTGLPAGSASGPSPNSVSQTLGGTAGTVEAGRTSRSPVVAGLMIAASIGGAALLVSLLIPRPMTGPGKGNNGTGEQSGSTPVRNVVWTIGTEPADVSVIRATDQKELGKTPWRSEQAPGTGSLFLILRRPGFADRVVTIDTSANAMIKENMQAVAPTPVVPTGSKPVTGPAQPPVAPPAIGPRWVKKGGKKVLLKGTPVAPAPTGTSPPQVTPAPTQTPPVTPPVPKPTPPQNKDEKPNGGRIQVLD